MTVARFKIIAGLPGCIPDYSSGPYALTRRRDVVGAFRAELIGLGIPEYVARQISWRRLWRGVVFARSASSVHVCVQHKNTVVEFCGLTEDEYRVEVADDSD